MYGESNVETHITVCKIGSQWEFSVWLRKLKQGLSINLRVWDGEGDSKGRVYTYPYGWFMFYVWQKQQNSVKQFKNEFKKREKNGGDICTPMTNSSRYMAEIKPILWSNYASVALETQTGALYQPRVVRLGGRWEGGSKGRGHVYTYGIFIFRFDRKQQNSVMFFIFLAYFTVYNGFQFHPSH